MSHLRLAVASSLVACVAILAACSSSSPDTPSTTPADAATETGAGNGDAGADTATPQTICQELGAPTTAGTPEVVATKAAASAVPVAQGGPIADGTYFLTSSTAYTDGPDFSTVKRHLIVTFKGTKYVGNHREGSNGDEGLNVGGTFTATNKTLTLTLKCTGASSAAAVNLIDPGNTYTATPTSITVIKEIFAGNGMPGSKIVSGDVYTKQ